MTKEYKDLSEAYQSIYEQQYEVFGGQRYTVKPDGTLTYPVDKRTKPTADELKTLTRPPSTTAVKPAPTPPAVAKPAPTPPPAATVSPPPTPAVPQKTFQQELDDLRKASAQATMAGPSKEAQALMSTRAKNILGPEKLKAGIEAQQRVERMKSEIGMPKVEAPKPAAVPPPASTLPPPSTKPETRQPTSPPPPKSSTGLTAQEKKEIDDFRKLSTLEKLSRKNEMEKRLSKLDPKKKQEVMDYYNRKESYEDLYDEVLDYLINEGYSEKESKKIMVENILNLGQQVKNLKTAAQMFRYMAGIDKMPVKPPAGPANLGNIALRGPSPTVTPKPKFQLGTPPKSTPPAKITPSGIRPGVGGTILALTQLQGDTPQSRTPQQQKARAIATSQYAARTGQFGRYGEPSSQVKPAASKPKPKTEPVKLKSSQPPLTKPKTDISTKPKPVAPEDPNLKKYAELRKTDPAAAKELGMKIWTQKYRPGLSRPDIA